MRKTKKSAFTIVELVIVIAVIAILSAVLIPTFGAIIKNANVAADQSAAATLTTELHIYLKGETIDSEAELMAAINAIDPDGKKLVPKALSYGHHFWFNMETQSIFAAYPEDVEDMEPAKIKATAEQDGPSLMSDVTPIADSTTYANVGIRDVYDKGYYLISNCGNLADALNLIENLQSAGDYENLIDHLEKAVENDDNSTAAQKVLDKVKNTTIRTQYGVFFYDGASAYEHISSTASYLSGPYYNYNPESDKAEVATAAPNVSNPVQLPSNIKAVMEGGLNYATAQGTTVEMPSVDAVIDIFTPASTNAIISIGGVEHIVTTTECAEHSDTCDVLAKKDGTIVDHLELKLAFEDFYIGYEGKTDGTTKHVVVGDTDEPNKIYVAYRNGKLQLHAVNTANVNETSNKVQEWKIDETATKYGTFDIDPKTGAIDLTSAHYTEVDGKFVCEIPVKAIAKNLSGVVVEDTVTVVVIKPVTATLNLGSIQLPFDGTSRTYPDLTFNGPLTSYDVSFNVTYSTDINGVEPLVLSDNYSVDIDTDNIVGMIYDGNKMSFKTNVNGELISDTYSFDISVDGCFATTISGDIIDATTAPVKFNYKQYNQGGRPQQYYVGTGVTTDGTTTGNIVYLKDLFTLANASKLGNAKVTVYANAELNDKLYPSYEIGKIFDAYKAEVEAGYITNDENPYTLDAEYTVELTTSNWDTAYIKFIGDVTSSYRIFVEIAPEHDVSTVVRLEVVNGVINVSDLNDLTADANGKITLSGNVALHGDCEIETGTTIDVGNKTLYGNGWVIDAEDYTAGLIADNKITETYTWCSYCETYLSECTGYAQQGNHGGPGYHGAGACNSDNYKDYSQTVDVTEYHYYSNVAMIQINGGTIDNIYINGPVYPDLQYTDNDCMLEDKSGHYDHTDTAYHVTGIKTTGDSTISNSYVKGFRQPVKVEGAAAVGSITEFTNDNGTADNTEDDYTDYKTVVTTEADNTTFTNTVLHGGNYANLVISSGNVTLNNVTTIQDFDGLTPTVNYDSTTDNFTVVGMGIILEGTTVPANDVLVAAKNYADALNSAGKLGNSDSTRVEKKMSTLIRPLSTKVDINGSLTQHNWMEKDLGNKKVPSVPVYTGKNVETSFVFNTIFQGVEMYGINLGRMGRFMHLTHQDIPVAGDANIDKRITDTRADNSAKNELVNLGIVFIDVEQFEGDPVARAAYAQYFVHIDESDSTSRKHSTANLQLTEAVSDMDVTAFLTDGADASLAIWSYADGRAWAAARDGLKAYATVIEYEYNDDGSIKRVVTDWNKVYVVTDDDKYYGGYYTTSGSYKNLYSWEINN